MTPAAGPVPPVNESVQPSSGAGPAATFTFTYSSTAGAAHIATAAQLIAGPTAPGMCLTEVLPASGTIRLWNEAGTAVLASAAVGANVVLAHSGCRVRAAGASVALAGTLLTVVVPYEFTAAFSGAKDVSIWASSWAGQWSAGSDLGDWLARGRIDSLGPSPVGEGQSLTLTGAGFGVSQGSSAVRINGADVPGAATTWTETGIIVTVPSGATSGDVVVVTNGTPSNGLPLTVGTGPTGVDAIVYYHSDALGSVRMITDGAGGMVARYDYLPFGQPYPSDQDAEPRRFGQLERTAGTGNGSWTLLDYAMARYYHSQSGRFTTPDAPIFGDPFDPQSMNLYAYARNNPLRFVDPTGQSHDSACPPDAHADICENVTAPIVDVGLMRFYIDALTRTVGQVVQTVEPIVEPIVHFVTAPRDPACMAGWASAGAARGLVVGTAVGVTAGGGVGVVVTAPGAVILNTAGGIAVGSVACMAAAGGGSGGGGGGNGGGLSAAARRKLGNLVGDAGKSVREVILSRGGNASNVRQAGHWADRTLGEAARAAVRGDESAETAIKLAKQAGRLGQRP